MTRKKWGQDNKFFSANFPIACGYGELQFAAKKKMRFPNRITWYFNNDAFPLAVWQDLLNINWEHTIPAGQKKHQQGKPI